MLDFIQKKKNDPSLTATECAGLITDGNLEVCGEEESEKEPSKLQSFGTILKGLKISKRNLAVAASVFVVGIAVYMNWFFFGGTQIEQSGGDIGGTDQQISSGDADDSVATYFAVTQLNRQRARDEAMETLQAVVDDPSALEDAKNTALAGISKIADEIALEADIETLIKGKGFLECVAVVNGDNANIVVKSDGLMPNEISQIQEIVYEVANILPMNTKIIEKHA